MYRRDGGNRDYGRGRGGRNDRDRDRGRNEFRNTERKVIHNHKLKELVEMLVSGLVTDKENISITEREKQGKIYYDVQVAESDMGKLLGRGGKTISSVRTIIRAAASKAGGEATVDVID